GSRRSHLGDRQRSLLKRRSQAAHGHLGLRRRAAPRLCARRPEAPREGRLAAGARRAARRARVRDAARAGQTAGSDWALSRRGRRRALSLAGCINGGPRMAPHTPRRSERPGGPVALLSPPPLAAARRTPGAPLSPDTGWYPVQLEDRPWPLRRSIAKQRTSATSSSWNT